jgi:hypothetical protein
MNDADRGRFEALFKVFVEGALAQAFRKFPFHEINFREREYWIENIQMRVYRAFREVITENLDLLLKAKDNKVHIRDAKTTAKEITKAAEAWAAQERKRAEQEGKRLIREMRDQEAKNLREVRKKIGMLRNTAAHLERRLGVMGPLLEARKVLADQLIRGRNRLNALTRSYVKEAVEQDILPSKGEVSLARKLLAEQLVGARHRLARLRNAGVRQETELIAHHQGLLPHRILSDLYPNPPLPECAPSETGLGIPEKSGIYFLWRNGVVEYVGLSINLNSRVRLKVHHVLRNHHDISFVLIERRDLTWAENWYIGALRPQLNYGRQAYHYNEESDPRNTKEQDK